MKFTYLSVTGFVFCLIAFPVIAAEPPSGGEFTITKSTIDAGGGTSEGDDFTLTGTIGQHDSTTETLAGGEFRLAGGFWANSKEPFVENDIFNDSFESE